jgi:hypothetical protein
MQRKLQAVAYMGITALVVRQKQRPGNGTEMIAV